MGDQHKGILIFLQIPLDLLLERGQKVALVGANGIGKTTLLRSLLGEIPSLKGEVFKGQNLEIGYFEQEIKPPDRTCLDSVASGKFRRPLFTVPNLCHHIPVKFRLMTNQEHSALVFLQ